jgi:exodeoxyribonuclease VII small subunit
VPRPKASTEHAAQSYEALVARLQQVVARLETGELPLAEAVSLYEEGVALSARCRQLLDAAELRVQQLLVGDEGVEETPWNAE